MVMANLHIICGNCGNGEGFEFTIAPEGHDITITDPEFEPAVFITCNNCSTIHDLNHNAIMVEAKNKKMQTDACSCEDPDIVGAGSCYPYCEKCGKRERR
jgi:hypothetical protein